MLQVSPDLVLEFASETRLAPSPRSRGVASLYHEILDHPVEDGVVVVPAKQTCDDEEAARLVIRSETYREQ